MKKLVIVFVVLLSMLSSGCLTLLPSSYDENVSNHDSYESVKKSYDMVVLHSTTKKELKEIGFDLDHGENVEILTYVEVSKIFLHNSAIIRSDLPSGILDCLEAKGSCKAYKISFESINKERYGNFWADVFDFRKKVHHTGWKFEALFIVVDDVVVYSLHSGQPNINKKEIDKNPLGPLQRLSGDDALDLLF